MPSPQQEEVDRNYDEFIKVLPSILASHRDKHALMKAGKVLGYYSSAEDARVAGDSFIGDKIFSIQRVTDATVDLGFFTYAVPVS